MTKAAPSLWEYQDAKTAPRPAYQRLPPKQEPKSLPIEVEEDTATSVIMRVIGKFKAPK